MRERQVVHWRAGDVADQDVHALQELRRRLQPQGAARTSAGETPCDSRLHLQDRRFDWFNNRRLLEPIGNIPSAEAEAAYYPPKLGDFPRKLCFFVVLNAWLCSL